MSLSFIGKILVTTGIIGSAFFFLNADNFALFKSQSWLNGDLVINKEVLLGSTFSVLSSQAGVATSTVDDILKKAKGTYDLSNIKTGNELIFVFNKNTNELKKLVYTVSTKEKLVVENNSSTTENVWEASMVPIEYYVEIDLIEGGIDSSLYKAITDKGIDARLAIKLAEVFAWQIDFAKEIKKDDYFKVIYEKKFLDGIYVMPGKILAAKFIASGNVYDGFYFKDSDGQEGYYDKDGKSLQKVFLKSPIQYKYISSGYSYNRLNPVTRIRHPHRAIDYAANYGTPVVSIGDGTVVQAGWNGDYGISVKIRHNGTYSTVYGHFSSLPREIKKGVVVKQGQVIGYVGSTGMSTGPHLHFEMHKFGSFINPLTFKSPDGKSIKEADRFLFEETKQQYDI
ncbi:peptidoglycan DD-metalloendopeptidase family protein [Patescibacteria group bacterium]|nr:peptidoglycan DD-metalloendopeptidase family protein [Patescibacteria group bacterium]